MIAVASTAPTVLRPTTGTVPTDRDDVVLKGPGMTTASYGNTPYGIWTGGGVQGILIANLTLRDFYFHPIIFNAGTQIVTVSNSVLMESKTDARNAGSVTSPR